VSPTPNPTPTQLAGLRTRAALRQLDEPIDVRSGLTDILAERAEAIGMSTDGWESAHLLDDENRSDVVADVVGTRQRQLWTLRASQYRFNDRFAHTESRRAQR
jgi:hypothetical protein